MTKSAAIASQKIPAAFLGKDKETLRIVDPSGEPAWDRELAALPGASFFHGAAWATVLHQAYGHRPFYLRLDSGSGLTGMLPLMEVASPLTGRRGVALPFTDVRAVLAADSGVAHRLLDGALELGRGRGWRYLEFRGIPETLSELRVSADFFSHEIDLRTGPEALLREMCPSARRAMRKAERSGVEIEINRTPAAMRTYFDLHCMTRKRHGLPPQPWAFFDNLGQAVVAGGKGFVAIARLSGQVVAAVVFLHFGRQVVYKYGASDTAFQRLRPNNLLFWEALRESCAKGFESFHLGASSARNVGLCRFKRSLGARQCPLHYVRYYFGRASWIACHDYSDSLANSVLRWLPVGALRRLGRLMYRHMSVIVTMCSSLGASCSA